MGHAEGYVLPNEVIFEKIQETVDLGGTGILMQGGLHPDLKIEWYEDLLRAIKQRFRHLVHCFSAPEIVNIAEVSGLSLRDTIARLRDAGLDSIPGGGAEILRRRRAPPHQPPEMHDARIGSTSTSQAHTPGHAHHRHHDVRLRRDHRAAHEPSRPRAPDSGRNRRLHGLHPLDLPAREHLARPLRQGRSDGRRVPENAGDLAALSREHPQRAVFLGDARA